MVVRRKIVRVCKGCRKRIILREYKGLEGGWYFEPHLCEQFEKILEKDPEADMFNPLPRR